ncbi:MAG: quaternary ammonium compound efflux SMR transporter SugE [Gammaproteobacteria bacterium]|nr:quaternary ammonium compound-resistance protein SugE [Gammaproteobacteria bacterium]
MSTAWIVLLAAGILEIAWALGLKFSDGLTRPMPAALTIAAMIASMALLAFAARSLPIGTAYAVWTGIGAAGTVILGILLLGESTSAVRLGCIALIVVGIVGLKLTEPA